MEPEKAAVLVLALTAAVAAGEKPCGFLTVERIVLAKIREVVQMNWDQIEGQWKQMKGKMKEKWGKITDSDWNTMTGKRDQLLGKIQERYGYSRDQAERELAEWEREQGSGKPTRAA